MVSVLVGVPLLAVLAHRIGLVDAPGGRKQHSHATPLTGGLAIFLPLLVIILLQPGESSLGALGLALALVVGVGVVDDLREVPAWMRFVVQGLAVLIAAVWGGMRLVSLGDLLGFGSLELGVMSIPFTLFAAIGVINSANMIDGLDGLAGGIMLGLFLILGVLARGLAEQALVWGACGALAGFLFYNFRWSEARPARVFLGDTGSTLLGLLAAWFLIHLSQQPTQALRPVTGLWLFGFPIIDTVAIMIRRIRLGRSPFSPDREHFHHILLLLGLGVRGTAVAVLSLHLLFMAIGLLGEYLQLAEPLMFYGYVVLFALYYWSMNHAWRIMRAIRQMQPDAAA